MLMQESEMNFAAIEAGGTKFVVATGNSQRIQNKVSIPTRDPNTTWTEVLNFLNQANSETPFSAIGLASFGPLELNPETPNYGAMGNTPKTNWQGVNMLEPLKQFDVPVSLETDVNAAALGETMLGNGKDQNTVVYVTVGTGIGVGIVQAGQVFHGSSHLELGHIPIPQDHEKDPFPGICPYHNNCLEGLASGKAIHARWGSDLRDLATEHAAYDLQAQYLGYLCSALILGYAPDKILLGGGVMHSEYLLQKVRQFCCSYLNSYPRAYNLKNIIGRPAHEGASALYGGFILACHAINE